MDIALVTAKASILGVIIGATLVFVFGILNEKYKYSWAIKEDTRKERKGIYISLIDAISSLPNKIVPSTINKLEIGEIQVNFTEMQAKLEKMKAELKDHKVEEFEIFNESLEATDKSLELENIQGVLDYFRSLEEKCPPVLIQQIRKLIIIAEQIKDRDEYLTSVSDFVDENWSEILTYASQDVKNLIVDLVHLIKPFCSINESNSGQPNIEKLKAVNAKIIETIRKELKVD